MAWLVFRGGKVDPPAQFTVNTPQGPVTYTVATPLPRQAIPGDRQRIEEASLSPTVFTNPTERFLARFAEPGRPIPAQNAAKPTEAEFAACQREQIRIASSDFTEVVDLKRIVAGMKREMRVYLASGQSVDQYIAELEKRQRLEISYRDNAQRRLMEMLSGQAGRPALKEAYAYWLKTNAQLQAMGIYPLALPDSLRTYQMNLDIED